MKRLATLMLAAAFVFAMAASASALEINVKGDMHFGFAWQDHAMQGAKFSKESPEDTFYARERIRLQIELVASENLKGVLYFHSSNLWWGTNGGALDTNKQSLYIRQGYIDWNVPNTGLNFKMGMQHLTLPGAVAGNPVMNDSVAGINATLKANDNVAISAMWARPWKVLNADKTSWDMFVLMVPLTFDGVKITPWGEYSLIGKYADAYDNTGTPAVGATPGTGRHFLIQGNEKKSNMYHLGVAADVLVGNALSIKGDFIYGGISAGGDSYETSGFFADLKVAYDLGMGKLGVAAWYSTGDDDDVSKKNGGHGKGGIVPSFVNTNDGNSGWAMSSMGFWGNQPLVAGGFVSQSGIGTAGIGLMFEDVSFIADLKHDLRFLVYTGTNDHKARENGWGWNQGPTKGGYYTGGSLYMTDKDTAWEINFDHKYQIAKGFLATLNLGYIYMDWQNSWKDANDLASSMWRVGFGVQYNF